MCKDDIEEVVGQIIGIADRCDVDHVDTDPRPELLRMADDHAIGVGLNCTLLLLLVRKMTASSSVDWQPPRGLDRARAVV